MAPMTWAKPKFVKKSVVWIAAISKFGNAEILMSDFLALWLPAYDIKFRWYYQILITTQKNLIFISVTEV